MIKKVDHIAIAVTNLKEALATYEKLFGLKPAHIKELPDQGVRAASLPIGEVELELLEPIDPKGGVARFLERKGEGLHHISFEVEDVDKELATLAAKNAELIDKKGRPGLAGKIGFLHPNSTRGVLIELAQKVPE